MRRLGALAALIAIVSTSAVASGAGDAAAGYATLRPSLVKVWSFDRLGRPVQSGSGTIIVSNAARSLVLTAAHVVAGAATIKVDIDRDRHDVIARVQERGPRDLAVLAIDRGGLAAATFAPRTRAVVEGNEIAVAGFVKNDELIGVVGQEPRLLFPGTISSRPDNGAYLELENVHVEEGLSGGPVFDPANGDVLGVVTSRTSDQRGGFADSGAVVVLPFLASNAIAYRERTKARAVAAAAPARPKALATPAVVALATAAPTAAPTLAAAVVVVKPAPAFAPPAAPSYSVPSPVTASYAASDASPRRLVYYHRGCAIALSVAVSQLQFRIPDAADTTDGLADARLTLTVGRRVAPVAACADVAESSPAPAAYEPTAASFDGRHLTIRFRYRPGAEATAADDALYPADISLDADVSAVPVTAQMQLMDSDWNAVLDVTAARAR